LITGSGSWTSEFLWLTTSVICDQERTVVSNKGLLEGVLGVLINELLVVSDEGLGDSLSDGVDLGNVTTSSNSDADVDAGELVEANNQERLVDL
jgi:hypothetical protein